MVIVYTAPKPARPLATDGWVAEDRRRAAATQAAVQPKLDEVNTMHAERATVQTRLRELKDPQTVEEAREVTELEFQRGIIDRQLVALNEGLEHGLNRQLVMDRNAATTNMLNTQAREAELRRQLQAHIDVLGPILFELYAYTADREDLALTIKVERT